MMPGNTPAPARSISILIRIITVCVCTSMMLVAGCTREKRDGRASDVSLSDPRRAERLHQQAIAIMSNDPTGAERLFREAIDADIFHGPAHNNLGTLLLARGELYEAATNFEAARKLMPGHPDPRLNLALTYEKAARYDDAIEMYNAALEVSPGHTPTVEALTRLEVTTSRANAQTSSRLRTIALEGSTKEWREWAARELLRQRDRR
jgi:Tfp pilus assembly protein PilF